MHLNVSLKSLRNDIGQHGSGLPDLLGLNWYVYGAKWVDEGTEVGVGRSVDFELTAVSEDAVVTQVIDALKTGERTRDEEW